MLIHLFRDLFFLALFLITWEDLSASLVFHKDNLQLRTNLGLRMALIPLAFMFPLPILYLLLLVFQILPHFIYKNVFNGASDYLCLLILTGICFASFFPTQSNLAYLYIALQVILSYFISGLNKLKEPKWRSGQALKYFLVSPKYYTPASIRDLTIRHAKLFSLLVLIWELSFPLSLFNLDLLNIYLIIGALFHLGNYFVFGLNRFFWLWISTYPLLIYFAQKVFNPL